MSGGRFNYQNDTACHDVFSWSVCPDYGMGDDDYETYRKLARKINPLEDKMLSELVYDVFCLLHSADWYLSGDTGEETYLKDVAFFKKKWLKAKNLTERELDNILAETRAELMKSLIFEPKGETDA